MGIIDNCSSVCVKFSERIHVSWDKETMFRLTLFIVWSTVLLKHVRGLLYHIPFFKDDIETVMVVVVLIPILMSVPTWLNRFRLVDHLFFFFCSFYLLSCYAFFPENTSYLNENVLTCIFCVFTFYFVGRVIDFDNYFNTFVLLSTLCIILEVFYNVVYLPGNKIVDSARQHENMGSAYLLLPHVGLLLWSALEKFRIWKVLVLFLGLVFLLACGTRGTFVCLGFFGIIYFFFYMQFHGAIFVKAGIIALVAVVFATLESTLLYLAKSFMNVNLSTRIIEKFLEGDLGNDSHRSVLREKLYGVLDNGDHFWGLGAFGSRNYDIIYPHFLPLDFFFTYGYFMGSVLMFFLFALIGTAFWMSKGTRYQLLILFLFSNSIIKLFLSSSFLIDPFFYMLIGVCVKVLLECQPKNLAQDSLVDCRVL